jgi:hypothetical protein
LGKFYEKSTQLDNDLEKAFFGEIEVHFETLKKLDIF